MDAAFREAFHSRYSTALVADAAYRAGGFVGIPRAGIHPLEPGTRIAGPAATVDANNDLVAILVALHRARSGDVLIIANKAGEAGLTGDILANEAKRGGIEAIVVDGFVRDTAEIRRIGQPVFARGRVPIGPLKLPPEQKGVGVPGVAVEFGGVTIQPGDWIVGDDDGILVLHRAELPAIMQHADETIEREKILVETLHKGTPLGDIFGIEEFYRKRQDNPKADFNEHLSSRKSAI